MKNLTRIFPLLLVASATGLSLTAGTVLPDLVNMDYQGDTTSTGNTFDRPDAEDNTPPVSLSSFAVNDLYAEFDFQVTTAGVYDFVVTPVDPEFWATYLFLYQTSFDPANPLTNLIAAGSNPDSTSNVTQSLTPGVDYVAVTTGFTEIDAGTFTDHISEEQSTATPEPATLLLVLPALLVGLCRNNFRSMTSQRIR